MVSWTSFWPSALTQPAGRIQRTKPSTSAIRPPLASTASGQAATAWSNSAFGSVQLVASLASREAFSR